MHGLIAAGEHPDGCRDAPGLDVASAEDGANRPAFFCSLVARGPSGVTLVTSDAHPELVAAIRASLSGAAWQRGQVRNLRDLLTFTAVPREIWGQVWSVNPPPFNLGCDGPADRATTLSDGQDRPEPSV